MANRKKEPTKVIRVPEALVPVIMEMVAEHKARTEVDVGSSGEFSFVRTLAGDKTDRQVATGTKLLTRRVTEETVS